MKELSFTSITSSFISFFVFSYFHAEMEDLYNLTADMLLRHNGNTLLKKYDNSVVKLVTGIYSDVSITCFLITFVSFLY